GSGSTAGADDRARRWRRPQPPTTGGGAAAPGFASASVDSGTRSLHGQRGDDRRGRAGRVGPARPGSGALRRRPEPRIRVTYAATRRFVAIRRSGTTALAGLTTPRPRPGRRRALEPA